ncbi:MAG TPA: cupin domain-containing protein [Mucilaginibacter sp.]
MNVKDYIASGILEEYCLGRLSADEEAVVLQICKLFPEVKKELAAVEKAIETLAAGNAITPRHDLKQKILNSLDFSDQAVQPDLNELPLINAHSNHRSWLNLLEYLIPDEPTEDFFCHVLNQGERFAQMLVISKNDVPEETHEDLTESFFILEGECICSVGEAVFKLGPGDYLEIPLHQPHNVKLLTPYVVAVLQYQYL